MSAIAKQQTARTPRLKRVLLSAGASLALVVGAAGIAAAADFGYADNGAGARAWVEDGKYVNARDTSCDGFSVNADYIFQGGGGGTLNNSSGCWTTREVRRSTRVDAIRACTVRPFLPDNCSSYRFR